MSRQSAGGKATAIILRKQALERYYASPNTCKRCHKVIEVPDGMKVAQVRVKKFCTRRCSAISSNIKRGKGNLLIKCLLPDSKSFGRLSIYKKEKSIRTVYKKKVSSRDIHNSTKKEVFDNGSSWQSARTAIRKHAQDIFDENGKKRECICGYKLHTQLCHIKPVSNFDDDSLISEINHIDNLIPLCPTHHWELDNGFLKL